MQEITRRGYSNYLNGIDAEILNQDQVAKKYLINVNGRYPVLELYFKEGQEQRVMML